MRNKKNAFPTSSTRALTKFFQKTLLFGHMYGLLLVCSLLGGPSLPRLVVPWGLHSQSWGSGKDSSQCLRVLHGVFLALLVLTSS